MKPTPLEPSLWYATAPPAPPTPPLDGSAKADVAVIGAGYCGLSAALHLAEAGVSVIVLEAREPGWGGSGRNNGHCVPDWLWHGPDEIAARFGSARGERVNDLQAGAADLVFSLIREHQIACEAVQSGTINVTRTRLGLDTLRAKAEQWSRRGKKVRLVEQPELAGFVGCDEFIAGVLLDEGGHLNPLAYCRGLAAAAQNAGAVVHGESPVVKIERAGSAWRVATPAGEVAAETVVMATNAHRHGLWPGVDDAYYCVRAYGAATAPYPEEIRRSILPGDHNVAEYKGRWDLIFFFDSAGRLVTGGGVGLGVNASARQVAAANGAQLARTFPQLGDVRIEYYWQGVFDIVLRKLVGVHELAPRLYAAVGFSGRGVPTATAVGRDLARMIIAGDADAMALPLTPLPRAPFSRAGAHFITNVVIPIRRVVMRLR